VAFKQVVHNVCAYPMCIFHLQRFQSVISTIIPYQRDEVAHLLISV